MKTYVARRLLALIPVGLVVATVAFLLMHLAPGNPASIIAGPDATPDDVRRRAAAWTRLRDLLAPKARSLQTDRQRAG